MHVLMCILGLYYGIYTYKFGFVKVLKKGEKKIKYTNCYFFYYIQI